MLPIPGATHLRSIASILLKPFCRILLPLHNQNYPVIKDFAAGRAIAFIIAPVC